MDQKNSAISSMLEKNLDHLPVKNSRRSLDVLLGVLAIFLVALSAFLYFENTNLKKQLGITPNPLIPKSCEYQGIVYQPGESIPYVDDCNSCTCDGATGQIACTDMACEVSTSQTQTEGWNLYIDPQNRFSFQYPNEMYQVPIYQGDVRISDFELSTSPALEETAMRISINPAQLGDIFTMSQEAPPQVLDQLEANSFFAKYPTLKKMYIGNPPFSYYAFFYPSDKFDTGNLVIVLTIHKQDEMPVEDGGLGGKQARLAGQILSTFEFTSP